MCLFKRPLQLKWNGNATEGNATISKGKDHKSFKEEVDLNQSLKDKYDEEEHSKQRKQHKHRHSSTEKAQNSPKQQWQLQLGIYGEQGAEKANENFMLQQDQLGPLN